MNAWMKAGLAAAMMLLFIFAAGAQTHVKKRHVAVRHHKLNINGLNANHHNVRRIGQGRADGSLTGMESRVANREENHLKGDRREARADGVVTRNEKRTLRHEAKNVSQSIHHLRHNNLGKMGPRKKPKYTKTHTALKVSKIHPH